MSAHGITVPKVTVTFSEEQISWLNWVASKRSTSVSDIIRRLIDETRGAYLTPAEARTAFRVSSDGGMTDDNATG